MKNIKKVGVLLDTKTHKKTKEFGILNNVSQVEIIRVLLEKTPIKINVREIGTIIADAKDKKQVNTCQVKLLLPESLDSKLKKMSIANNTSFSEIIRKLIYDADFNKFTFKTRGENILNGKAKKKSK